MTLDEINAKEKKENEAFLNWIKSPSFQLQSHTQRTTDLELYMIAKNREIGDLEAEVNAKANRITELEKGLSEVKTIIKG